MNNSKVLNERPAHTVGLSSSSPQSYLGLIMHNFQSCLIKQSTVLLPTHVYMVSTVVLVHNADTLKLCLFNVY